MYCYRINDNLIEKYSIIFDSKKVDELKKEIIERCSIIEHHKYESDYYPRFGSGTCIKNFSEKEVGKKVYFEETRTVYSFSYDEYKPPYLVELIEHLEDGSISYLNEMLNYDTTNKPNLIDAKIYKIKEELKEMIDKNEFGIKKENKEEELSELMYTKKINQNQEPIAPYYKKLLELIRFELVDVISMEEVKKVEEFLGVNLLKEYKFVTADNEEINKKLIRKID